MTLKVAAVLEPKAANHKSIAAGLKKAGLTVTAVRDVEALTRAQLVVVGPSVKSASRLVGQIRKQAPGALVLVAQARGFKAAYADAVLPLPVSANDLKVRLAEWVARSKAKEAPSISPRPGDGILDPLTNFYTFNHFKEVLFVEVKRARRYGFPLALALIGFDPLPTRHEGHMQEQLMGGLALAIRRSLRDNRLPGAAVERAGAAVDAAHRSRRVADRRAPHL